jgi:hypothetical protein
VGGIGSGAVNCFSACSILLFKFVLEFKSLFDEDPKAALFTELVVNPFCFPAFAEFLVIRTVVVSFLDDDDIVVSVVERINFYCFRNCTTKLFSTLKIPRGGLQI